jgi:hypothetical protein
VDGSACVREMKMVDHLHERDHRKAIAWP